MLPKTAMACQDMDRGFAVWQRDTGLIVSGLNVIVDWYIKLPKAHLDMKLNRLNSFDKSYLTARMYKKDINLTAS